MPSVAKRTAKPGRGTYDRKKTAAQRAAERQTKLFLAAARVFARVGFANASVQLIVDEAGVSRQAFYQEFSDLRDALVKLNDYSRALLFRAIEQNHKTTDDPVERLRRSIEINLLGYAAAPAMSLCVTREVLALGNEGVARKEAIMSRYAALLMEGAAEAYARGLVDRPPDETTAYFLVSGIDALTARYLEHGRHKEIHELLPKLMDLVMTGLGFKREASD